MENKQQPMNGIIRREPNTDGGKDSTIGTSKNYETLVKKSEKIQTATPSKPIYSIAKHDGDVVDSSSTQIKPATKPTVAQPKTKLFISKKITDYLGMQINSNLFIQVQQN